MEYADAQEMTAHSKQSLEYRIHNSPTRKKLGGRRIKSLRLSDTGPNHL